MRNGLGDPIFANAARGKTIRAIGKLDIPHQWAFVPDLARAAADLLEDGHTLEPFDVVHFASFVAGPQRGLLRLVAEEAGHPGLSIQQIPWWMLRVIGLFSGIVRELIELRYLFDDCVILDGSRLRKLLPQFADTPVREAVRETLESHRRSRA